MTSFVYLFVYSVEEFFREKKLCIVENKFQRIYIDLNFKMCKFRMFLQSSKHQSFGIFFLFVKSLKISKSFNKILSEKVEFIISKINFLVGSNYEHLYEKNEKNCILLIKKYKFNLTSLKITFQFRLSHSKHEMLEK